MNIKPTNTACYQNTLSVIGGKFSADLKHKEGGSVLTFDKDKFDSYNDVYSHQVEGQDPDLIIKVSLIQPEPEGTEGTDGLIIIKQILTDL